MTRKVLLLAPAVACLVFQLGCGMLSDPAVRLANCMEDGLKNSKADAFTRVNCDLKQPGNYVVVLHPDGQRNDDELRTGGVPDDVIPELRAMRIGDNASIYVISTDPKVTGTGVNRTVKSSRTTYQNNFVHIDKLIVLSKTTPLVAVEIAGPAGARTIQSIR